MNLAEFATEEVRARARRVARGRLALAQALGRSQPFGDPGDEKRLFVDAWAALAEVLVAEWLGLEWNDRVVESLLVKPPDVGRRTEVRWTVYDDGHLIVHPTDADEAIIVLVCCELPEMRVAGWTLGRTAKWFRPGRGARNETDKWVPQRALLLPELLYQMRHGDL